MGVTRVAITKRLNEPKEADKASRVVLRFLEYAVNLFASGESLGKIFRLPWIFLSLPRRLLSSFSERFEVFSLAFLAGLFLIGETVALFFPAPACAVGEATLMGLLPGRFNYFSSASNNSGTIR